MNKDVSISKLARIVISFMINNNYVVLIMLNSLRCALRKLEISFTWNVVIAVIKSTHLKMGKQER
jgi:hypothetical protein